MGILKRFLAFLRQPAEVVTFEIEPQRIVAVSAHLIYSRYCPACGCGVPEGLTFKDCPFCESNLETGESISYSGRRHEFEIGLTLTTPPSTALWRTCAVCGLPKWHTVHAIRFATTEGPVVACAQCGHTPHIEARCRYCAEPGFQHPAGSDFHCI